MVALLAACGVVACSGGKGDGGGGSERDAGTPATGAGASTSALKRMTVAFSAATARPPKSDNIFIARADGSWIRRVTRRPGGNSDPDWSPDGKQIAFRSEAPGPDGEQRGAVWVVDADGSNLYSLSRRAGMAYGAVPSWSPDGKRIAISGFRREGEASGIYTVGLDGSDLKRLTPAGREAQYPAWSPDGRRIAYTLVDGGGFDLYVMNADGSGQRRLTSTPDVENWAMWSPDSEQIAFHVEGERASVEVMNADGSGRHRIANTRGAGVPGNWAPGSWLILACPLRGPSDSFGVCAVRPDGTGFARLLGGREANFPAWRP